MFFILGIIQIGRCFQGKTEAGYNKKFQANKSRKTRIHIISGPIREPGDHFTAAEIKKLRLENIFFRVPRKNIQSIIKLQTANIFLNFPAYC